MYISIIIQFPQIQPWKVNILLKKIPKAPVLFFDWFWKTIEVVIYNAKMINCWSSKHGYSALLDDWETKIYFQIELESDSFIQLNYHLLEISFLLFQLHVMKEKKSIPLSQFISVPETEEKREYSQNRNKTAPKVSLSVPSDLYTRSLRNFSKQSREVNVGFLASSCSKPHLQRYT